MRDAQDEQATKTIEETQKQIQAYYSKAMRRIIAEFEATYDKLLNTAKDGKPPTVADLYKLDIPRFSIKRKSRNSGKRNKMNYPHYGSNNLPMLSIKNFGKGGSKFE